METKHTPGEWRTVYESKTGTVVKTGEKTIAKVFRNINLIEINANARLIAAAPELLEALIKCKHFLNHGIGMTKKDQQEIDLIIKKATT